MENTKELWRKSQSIPKTLILRCWKTIWAPPIYPKTKTRNQNRPRRRDERRNRAPPTCRCKLSPQSKKSLRRSTWRPRRMFPASRLSRHVPRPASEWKEYSKIDTKMCNNRRSRRPSKESSIETTTRHRCAIGEESHTDQKCLATNPKWIRKSAARNGCGEREAPTLSGKRQNWGDWDTSRELNKTSYRRYWTFKIGDIHYL